MFIAGGFDLSVGAISSFSGGDRRQGVRRRRGRRSGRSLILGALTGLGFGIVNGLLVTLGRVNAFIATLATRLIIYGIAVAVTGGFLVSVSARVASDARAGRASGRSTTRSSSGSPSPLFCGFLLSRTAFGRYVYAAGGNAEAARLVRRPRQRRPRDARSRSRASAAGIAGVILASEVGDRAGGRGQPRHRVQRDHRRRPRRDLDPRRRGRDLARGARRLLPADDRQRLQPAQRPAGLPGGLQGRDPARRRLARRLGAADADVTVIVSVLPARGPARRRGRVRAHVRASSTSSSTRTRAAGSSAAGSCGRSTGESVPRRGRVGEPRCLPGLARQSRARRAVGRARSAAGASTSIAAASTRRSTVDEPPARPGR